MGDYSVSESVKRELFDKDCGVELGYERANKNSKEAGDMFLYIVDLFYKCPDVPDVFLENADSCEMSEDKVSRELLYAVDACQSITDKEKKKQKN